MLKIPRYWQDRIIEELLSESWLYKNLPPLPPLPLWRRIIGRIYWGTIGRFKNWLHRDCGEY